MTAELDGDAPRSIPFARKIGWTVLTGFVAFAGSALLDNVLEVSLADQLVLTFITGGVTLLVQYLSDFEQRLRESERYQRQMLDELHNNVQRGFAGVSEATILMEDIERSALQKESLKNVIRRASHLTSTAKPLLRGLADSEIERLAGTLQSLADGHEVFYDGEDREFLLALTRKAATSIMAMSWATATANGTGFEAGFWLSDLGGRYFDLQREALRRGVSIKRIFVVEARDLIRSDPLKRVVATQQRAGVEVKLLESGLLPPSDSVGDFVIFDEEVAYITTPVARGGAAASPWLLNTRLAFDDEVIHYRMVRFDEFWDTPIHP